MDSLVLLATVPQNPEAILVKSFLESKGIHSVISGELSNQLFGYVINSGGVSISVKKKDLSEAIEFMLQGGFKDFLHTYDEIV